MASEEDTQIDDSSPFRSQAEVDATIADVYQQSVEDWVISPLKILWSDYRGKFGLSVVLLYVLMGTVGVALYPTTEPYGGPLLLSPFQSLEHPLGTDGTGQDLLALMIHATPAMFKMMAAGAIFGNMLGVSVGLLSGYNGGTIDKVLMTISDTLMSIPGLPLLLILAALIEPSNPYLIGVILNIQGWTGIARAIRAQVLPLRNKEYVEASEVLGQSQSNILLKQVLPDLLPYLTIGFMTGATTVITASVGLYFLGVLPFTTANWGVVLNQAYNSAGALYSLDAAHWLLVPMVVISGMTFGLTLLAQAFDQVFNPRVRARHQARKHRDDESDVEADEEEMGAVESGVMGGMQ